MLIKCLQAAFMTIVLAAPVLAQDASAAEKPKSWLGGVIVIILMVVVLLVSIKSSKRTHQD
jgi:hypothetical protein